MTMGGATLGYLVIALATGQLAALARAAGQQARRWCPCSLPGSSARQSRPSVSSPASVCSGLPAPRSWQRSSRWWALRLPHGCSASSRRALQLVGGALILVAAVLLQVGGTTASDHEAVAG